MKVAFIGGSSKEGRLVTDRLEKLAAALAERGWESRIYAPMPPKQDVRISEEIPGRLGNFSFWQRCFPLLPFRSLATVHALLEKCDVIHYADDEPRFREKSFFQAFFPGTKAFFSANDLPFFLQGVSVEKETDARSLYRLGLRPKRYLLVENFEGATSQAHFLIKAFLNLEKKNKMSNNFKLVVIGGSGSPEYQKYLHVLSGKKSNVIFLQKREWLEHTKARATLFSQALGYASLSPQGLSIGVLEVMAQGVPPLLARSEATASILQRNAALLITENLTRLEEKLAYLINRSSVAEALGQKARRYVETVYSWEALAEEVSDAYTRALVSHDFKKYAIHQ